RNWRRLRVKRSVCFGFLCDGACCLIPSSPNDTPSRGRTSSCTIVHAVLMPPSLTTRHPEGEPSKLLEAFALCFVSPRDRLRCSGPLPPFCANRKGLFACLHKSQNARRPLPRPFACAHLVRIMKRRMKSGSLRFPAAPG